MDISKKTILITGGAGFVGSHLTEKLLEKGAKVVIVDDFSNGSWENLKNIEDKVTVITFDISKPFKELSDAVGKFRYDGIFHLACFPRSMSLKNPYRDIEVNARGTINVLELARISGSKVVFTSNSGIYGEPEYLAIDEKHPDKPSTPYDANKLVSEYYLKIYNNIYGIPIGICRLATVFGERQRTKEDWKPLIPEFASKLMLDQSPTINWDGEQTRDLIYVKDVVQGLTKAFASDHTNREVFLLSTNRETSVNEIYRIICEALGKKIQPKRAGMVPGDIKKMILSYSKAEKAFGYKPEYTLEQGIINYIKWLKSN